MTTAIAEAPAAEQKFVRGLGLLDSTMLVAGSMIGSGIFIVSADIARLVGSAGWLLVVWAVTGVLTMVAAHTNAEEPTSELQSQSNLVCRLLLEKTKTQLRTTVNAHTRLLELSPENKTQSK